MCWCVDPLGKHPDKNKQLCSRVCAKLARQRRNCVSVFRWAAFQGFFFFFWAFWIFFMTTLSELPAQWCSSGSCWAVGKSLISHELSRGRVGHWEWNKLCGVCCPGCVILDCPDQQVRLWTRCAPLRHTRAAAAAAVVLLQWECMACKEWRFGGSGLTVSDRGVSSTSEQKYLLRWKCLLSAFPKEDKQSWKQIFGHPWNFYSIPITVFKYLPEDFYFIVSQKVWLRQRRTNKHNFGCLLVITQNKKTKLL